MNSGDQAGHYAATRPDAPVPAAHRSRPAQDRTPTQGVIRVLQRRGLRLYDEIFGRLFDIRYGTDTCRWVQLSELAIDSDNKTSGIHYQPTGVMRLRRLFNMVEPLMPSNSVLVDFGCGKGRVLLVAAEFGFREVRGVEFAHELCSIARRNSAAYRAKTGVRTELCIMESDAVDYAIQPDETVFFMFHPFDETILGKVLDNIAASVRAQQRKVLIIYDNPRCRHVFEQREGFAEVREVDFWGQRCVVYSNRA